MKESPLVSVLMPAYNCERFVKEAISCVLNQTYSNWELLIADDASTDGTKKIINQYNDPRIRFYHNDKNLGYLRTWNKLIAMAKGAFITFLDADDTCSLDRIEKTLTAFEKNLEIDVIGSNFNRVNERGQILFTSNFFLTHAEIVSKMPKDFNIVGSGLMIKKKVYETIGGYNLFFDRIGAEDYYWIYLISEQFKIMNLSEALYNYRFNSNSVMGNLTVNPQKLFVYEVLQEIIGQRIRTGTDDISTGNSANLSAFLEKKLDEVGREPYQLLSFVARRRFYEGHLMLSIKLQLKAIAEKPFKSELYKDFFYFISASLKEMKWH